MRGSRQVFLLAVVVAGAAPVNAAGQEISVGGRGGTFGLGGEVVLGFGGTFALRAGLGAVPVTPGATFSGIRYEVEPPSMLATAGADVHLTGGLRLVGGILFGAEETDFTARLTRSTRIGSHVYTPEQAGTLLGTLRSRKAAPFVGLGFGSYDDARVGVTLEVGVAFLGENDLELAATGSFASDATFRQDLELERAAVEDDLRRYTRYLPMLNLGIHVVVAR